MEPWPATLLAYAVGCLSFATLACRLKGVDIRSVGSGNPGATNVRRALGPGWGRAVLMLDVAKGALPVLLLQGPPVSGDPEGRSVILAAAVAGHVFPITLGFRGGKGVATLIGGYLALDWRLGLASVALHYGLRAATGYVSVASVALSWAFPAGQELARLLELDAGVFTGGTPVLALLAVLVTLRHLGNFGRIRAGTEDRYDGPSRPG
jgi:glycerol-3-phosphate acyltransferase PlsY